MKSDNRRARLDITKYVKISQILTENKTKWGNSSKTINDLRRLLELSCKFEVPESTLKKISDELGYKLKRRNNGGGKMLSSDRTRYVASLVSKMFVDLERQLGMEIGTIGKDDGTRDALRSIVGGVALDKIIEKESSQSI